MAKIYISSTYNDLKVHRERVYRALRRLRHDVIAMEDYVATDQRPLDKCLADVAASDLYVGVFAWRYGFIPNRDNPERKSITELEYRQAQKRGIPALIFLLNKDADWPQNARDSVTGQGANGVSIQELRAELQAEKIVSFFDNEYELAETVAVAVSKASEPPSAPGEDKQGGITIGKIEAVNVAESQVIDQSGSTFNMGERTEIDTGGGAYIGGNVTVEGGDFVGRDKIVGRESGDLIVAVVGAGAKNVAVGKEIDQTIYEAPGGPAPDDKTIIREQMAALTAHRTAAQRQQAQFPLQVLETELSKTGEDEQPSGSAVMQAGDWLLGNLPDITDALAEFFALPAVGRVVAKAGAETVEWRQRRLGMG